ncbi:hypothetical protein K9N50_07450 [bacterium]|nr:hypothetical protein [bacterium]
MKKYKLRLISGLGIGIAMFLLLTYSDNFYIELVAVLFAYFGGYFGAKGQEKPLPNSQTGKMTGII